MKCEMKRDLGREMKCEMERGDGRHHHDDHRHHHAGDGVGVIFGVLVVVPLQVVTITPSESESFLEVVMLERALHAVDFSPGGACGRGDRAPA
jgi:hypothetical protein